MDLQDILKLSVQEKILLVEKLWNSIAADIVGRSPGEWKEDLPEDQFSHNENAGSDTSSPELKP